MDERVEGHPHLTKDSITDVINNRADVERERYRTAKKHAIESIKTKDELDEVKKDLENIKHLLKQLGKVF